MTRGPGPARAQHVREAYPHEKGAALISTPQAMALMGIKRNTFLRRMRALEIEPARRGKHGRLWWRRADVERLLDNELQPCNSGG